MAILFLVSFGRSQDLSNIAKKDPVKFSGGIGISANMFGTSQDINRRSPFSYGINANPTLTLYGLRIPFSVSIRNSQLNYSKPFNRFGLSPQYKWIRLHLGHRSMQFSPYTLSGHTFIGGGVELTPGNFRFAALYGRFQNHLAQQDTLLYGAKRLATPKRIGYGVKVGFGSDQNFVDLMLFKAKDKVEGYFLPDSIDSDLRPAENLAIGIQTKATLFKQLSVGFNVGGSVFSEDQRAEPIEIEKTYQKLTQTFLTPNSTSRFAFAGDAFARLRIQSFTIGIKYKRVEPFYRTLGSYYTRDDFQNITFNTSFSAFKRKVNLDGSFGVQQNNLYNTRLFTNLRKIASVNLNVRPSSLGGVNIQYSNYQQDQNPGLIAVDDTLRYAIASNNLSIVPNLVFRTPSQNTHTISFAYIGFDLKDLSEFYDNPQNTSTKNLSISYRFKSKQSGFGLRGGLNYNTYDTQGDVSNRYGGTVGVDKELFEKQLKLSMRSTYNIRTTEGIKSGNILRHRFSARLKVEKKHQLYLNFNLINKNFIQKEDLRETRVNTGYSYSF